MKEKPSVDFILNSRRFLEGIYGTRNAEYALLRDRFKGSFLAQQVAEAMSSTASVFNDKIKVVYNLQNATVRRYMDEMSAPVRLRCSPAGMEDEDIDLAEKRNQLLEQIHRAEKMPVKIIMAAFHQSLLDKAIFHVRPAPEKKHKVSINLVIPESYLPMPSDEDWFEKKFVIHTFGQLALPGEKGGDIQSPNLDPDGRTKFSNVQQLRRTEYWDETWYICVEDGKEKFALKHGWGVIPDFAAHNLPMPHQERGQGDVDQSVGLNEYLNQLYSDQADIINYLANPIVVVRGSKSGVGNLLFAPRAVWELERDGSAEILSWAGSPPTVEAQILRTMQAHEDVTGATSTSFGRDVPSGTSGSAVRSLLAGFNTRVGTKQQLMGEAIADAYRMVQMVLEKEFPNEGFQLPGHGLRLRSSHAFKPKEMKGFYDLQVMFEPADQNMKVFTELEKMRGGLQSRYTTMKNIGITNPREEMQRIMIEELARTQIRTMAKRAAQPNTMNLGGYPGGEGGEATQPAHLINPDPGVIPEDVKREAARAAQEAAQQAGSPDVAAMRDLLAGANTAPPEEAPVAPAIEDEVGQLRKKAEERDYR